MTQVAGPHSEHYRVRDEELLVGLRRELLGPGQEAVPDDRDEVLTQDAPIDRYLTGVLYPRAADKAAKERKDEDAAEQDGLDAAPCSTEKRPRSPAPRRRWALQGTGVLPRWVSPSRSARP